jgi:hypothetical protein
MIADHLRPDTTQRTGHGVDLPEYFDAFLILFHHGTQTAHLTFDSSQSFYDPLFVLIRSTKTHPTFPPR